eukprot:6343861-Alexandrium_andersonii.AAC.1
MYVYKANKLVLLPISLRPGPRGRSKRRPPEVHSLTSEVDISKLRGRHTDPGSQLLDLRSEKSGLAGRT